MIDDFDLFCFDFDGTIGDTEPDIRAGWMKAIEKMGWRKDNFDAVFRVGPPLSQTAAALYPEKTPEELEILQNTYKHFYDDMDNQIAQPYPGVIEVIHRLFSLNKRVYVVTNKRGKILTKMMKKFGLCEYCHGMFFPDLVSQTNHLSKNDLLAMAIKSSGFSADRTLMIGDTLWDMEAARANNCRAAAVTWGYCTAEELNTANPEYLIDSPEQLLE